MFTELIKTYSIIVDVLPLSSGIKLCITSELRSEVGSSISWSGACLTVVVGNE
ncbi:hypothetical protein [Candidatus Hodgkinia cicadicola]|uniref:hypothetical protein n=1 Tax=Candidatus Hodgkinia cicadicola TaxID=573658 RepID=UPI001788A705